MAKVASAQRDQQGCYLCRVFFKIRNYVETSLNLLNCSESCAFAQRPNSGKTSPSQVRRCVKLPLNNCSSKMCNKMCNPVTILHLLTYLQDFELAFAILSRSFPNDKLQRQGGGEITFTSTSIRTWQFWFQLATSSRHKQAANFCKQSATTRKCTQQSNILPGATWRGFQIQRPKYNQNNQKAPMERDCPLQMQTSCLKVLNLFRVI